MKITLNLSPNYSKKPRLKKEIKFVIIHYTGMQSEIESINRLKSPNYNVSCHYFINRKGKITQMVKDLNIAWHAGKSKWKNFNNLNSFSIGIELDNKGHQFGYNKFSGKQIVSLINLCKKMWYLPNLTPKSLKIFLSFCPKFFKYSETSSLFSTPLFS